VPLAVAGVLGCAQLSLEPCDQLGHLPQQLGIAVWAAVGAGERRTNPVPPPAACARVPGHTTGPAAATGHPTAPAAGTPAIFQPCAFGVVPCMVYAGDLSLSFHERQLR
jgi:hypothetical protein